MRISRTLRRIVLASTATFLLALCCSAPAIAGSGATIVSGFVEVDKDGTVSVQTATERLFPSNGHGLLMSGKIRHGEEVDVKIVHDKKKPTHRGHVTVLK